jgi:hypothetical protein
MSKQPCVHDEVCVWISESYDCDFEKCSNYLPSMLPALKQLLKIVRLQYTRIIKNNIVYDEGVLVGEIRILSKIIRHLEKRGDR